MLQRIGSWACVVGKGYNRELMYQDSGSEQGDNGIATGKNEIGSFRHYHVHCNDPVNHRV